MHNANINRDNNWINENHRNNGWFCSLSLDNNNSNGRRLKCNRTDLPKNVICVWVCAVWPTQTHQSTFYLSLFNWKSMVVHSIWWAWLWIIGLRYWLLLSHFHFHLVAICSNFMWYMYVWIIYYHPMNHTCQCERKSFWGNWLYCLSNGHIIKSQYFARASTRNVYALFIFMIIDYVIDSVFSLHTGSSHPC